MIPDERVKMPRVGANHLPDEAHIYNRYVESIG